MSSRADARSRLTRQLIAGSLAALVMLLMVGSRTVSAHATLVVSDPADGATLARTPDQIRLTFSESVSVELSRMRLVDGDGRIVVGAALAGDPGDAAVIIVRLPTLETGIYRLEWRVVDGNDLHATESTLVFGLRQAVTASGGGGDPAPNTLEAAVVFVDRVLQAALIGALAMLAVTSIASRRRRRPEDPTRVDAPSTDVPFERVRNRLRHFACSAGVNAIACGIVLIFVQTLAVAGDRPIGEALATVLATGHGAAWILGEAALVGLTITLLRTLGSDADRAARARDERGPGAAPRDRQRRARVVPIVLVGGLALSAALGGHANVGDPDETPMRLLALAIHDLAAATWVGGLIVLALVVAPMFRRTEDRSTARSLVGAFAWIAVPSVVALAVTGIYLAGQMVATVDALGTTGYGRFLVAKVAIVIVLLAIGGANAAAAQRGLRSAIRRAVPAGVVRRMTPARPTASIRLEAAAALVVVLLGAILGATQPARGVGLEPAVGGVAQPDVTTRVDDLLVSFAVRPNRPGDNFVSIGVFDTRRPAPAPIEGVTVRLVSPAGEEGPAVAAVRRSAGRYEAAMTGIEIAGDWRVAIAVERPGLSVSRLDSAWTVRPPDVVVAASPLAGIRLGSITTPLAAVILAIALACAAAFARPRLAPANRRAGTPKRARPMRSPAGRVS